MPHFRIIERRPCWRFVSVLLYWRKAKRDKRWLPEQQWAKFEWTTFSQVFPEVSLRVAQSQFLIVLVVVEALGRPVVVGCWLKRLLWLVSGVGVCVASLMEINGFRLMRWIAFSLFARRWLKWESWSGFTSLARPLLRKLSKAQIGANFKLQSSAHSRVWIYLISRKSP